MKIEKMQKNAKIGFSLFKMGVERIIKKWRIDLDNKSTYIEKLKEEIKRLSN